MSTIKPSAGLALLLVTALAAAGCTDPGASSTTNNAKPPAQTENEAPAAAVSYPIATETTLTYWLQTPTTLKPSIDEVPFFQEWRQRVGVPVDFVEVSPAQAKESFSVMLASGQLPDIIEYNWQSGLPGGPEKALQDGYILRLNELIDAHAPNLKRYLEAHPEIDKLVKTDNGDYYAFPFLKEGGMTTQWEGPALRKDWLAELDLSVPSTIDEWHTVLTAFKEQKDARAPLTILNAPNALQGFLNGAFVGAFGVNRGFYIDKQQQVQYGPLQSGYKQFLETMNQWYKEGLLDPSFTQTDRKAQDANIVNGDSGATIASGAGFDKWTHALSANDPAAGFVFAPYPVLTPGETPMFGQEAWMYGAEASAAVSASTKHPELAVQLLDYAYSDEGYLFFNYGTEGLSYTLANGEPQLTELIRDNPDNLSYLEALGLYTHTVNPGPYVASKELIGSLAATGEDHNYDRWKTDNLKHVLPPVSISADEASEYARIMADINTLVDETSLKMILGTESIQAYDDLAKKLNSLQIGRALEIQQAAYDRFLQR